MRLRAQCWTCGEFVLLVAPVVYAGNYPCPVCGDGLLHVPITKESPIQTDEFEVQPAFEVLTIEGVTRPKG
jgi:Zn finger protein HypA/HybF involved in hydrogenase expression